ncbi:MAG TPA: nitrilase-related carbon-nitrogen hydrolase [Gemmatimonadaceae bacterium]|nr:nitrilase-related carbon-nitrogen hydrolase [Gemmatimonadaceae bacterium]
MTSELRVVLGEYDTSWHDPATSLERAGRLVRGAAKQGAHLVALPEMCLSGFTMEPKEHAVSLDSPHVRGLSALAAESGVHLLAGVAARELVRGRESFVNTALLFGPSGELDAAYRKQKLFAYANEHASYEPGEGPATAMVRGVRIGLFICYDLRFPELFRAIAPDVDAMFVIANWPAGRRPHWDALLPARAIENQCYVIGVNRIGDAGGLSYDGGSAAYDPWGERLAPTPAVAGAPGCVTLTAERVAEIRGRYPFIRDLVRESAAIGA